MSSAKPICARFRPVWAVAVLGAALTWTPAGGGLATQARAETQDGATRVNQLLVALKQPKNGDQTRTYEIAEKDLNEFTRAALRGKQRLGVKSVQLDLQERGGIAAVSVVNMDEVELEGLAVSMFKTVLSGTQTLRTKGRLNVKNGKASYQVEEASFNGVWVPAWLVNSVISFLGKRQPPHIDPTEPFDLPYGISDVRVDNDKLVILR